MFRQARLQGVDPLGTSGVTPWVNEVGAFPTRTSGPPSSKTMKASAARRSRSGSGSPTRAASCPTPCGKYSLTRVGERQHVRPGARKLVLGGNCMLRTIEEVAYANYLCDELGLDTISGGSVVAFALECAERHHH